jgi:hypothetical protein
MHNLNRIALGKRGYWPSVQADGWRDTGLTVRCNCPETLLAGPVAQFPKKIAK